MRGGNIISEFTWLKVCQGKLKHYLLSKKAVLFIHCQFSPILNLHSIFIVFGETILHSHCQYVLF